MISTHMMWRKSWWECRFRVVLAALVVASLIIGAVALMTDPATGGKNPQAMLTFFAQLTAGMVVPLMTLLMAGSGVNSQTSWGMLQGFHSSMYFLLSMPVSRRRALLIRAAVGGAFSISFIVVTQVSVALLAGWRGLPMSGGQIIAFSLENRKFPLLSWMAGLHSTRTGDIVWPALLTFIALGVGFMAASVYVVEKKEY